MGTLSSTIRTAREGLRATVPPAPSEPAQGKEQPLQVLQDFCASEHAIRYVHKRSEFRVSQKLPLLLPPRHGKEGSMVKREKLCSVLVNNLLSFQGVVSSTRLCYQRSGWNSIWGACLHKAHTFNCLLLRSSAFQLYLWLRSGYPKTNTGCEAAASVLLSLHSSRQAKVCY